MNLGYACINMTLGKQKPKITTNRSMIKRTFTEKGIPCFSRVGLFKTPETLLRLSNGIIRMVSTSLG